MKKLICALALTLALPILALAQQTLAGKWEGQTPNRQSIVLELTVKDADVSGTMTVSDQKSAIENGRLSKTTFTFSVAMGGGVEAFTGEFAGADIRIWMDDRGPSSAVVLKRAK